MKFNEELRQEKARLGLTLAELAKELEVGQRTVEYWLDTGEKVRVPLKITQEGALARLRKKKVSV